MGECWVGGCWATTSDGSFFGTGKACDGDKEAMMRVMMRTIGVVSVVKVEIRWLVWWWC
jgi:hypothetical protein